MSQENKKSIETTPNSTNEVSAPARKGLQLRIKHLKVSTAVKAGKHTGGHGGNNGGGWC